MAHIYSIATTSGLQTNQTGSSFKFVFTVNFDEAVYYVGHFDMEEVTYDNNKTSALNGFSNKFNVEIIDTNRLIRDYNNITKETFRDITWQLLQQSIDYVKSGKLSNKAIQFNVEITV